MLFHPPQDIGVWFPEGITFTDKKVPQRSRAWDEIVIPGTKAIASRSQRDELSVQKIPPTKFPRLIATYLTSGLLNCKAV